MLQVIHSPKIYDACIIGHGAAGGAAAKVLTEGGVSVVMLEAGPPLDPAEDFKEHLWPYDLSHRGAGVGGKLRGEEPTSSCLSPNWSVAVLNDKDRKASPVAIPDDTLFAERCR